MKTVTEEFEKKVQSALFPVPLDKVLFFDIETTGLSPRTSSLYLIGTIYFHASSGQFKLTQWFADNSRSEQEMLLVFLEQLEQFDCLCHFNGRTFDIPYVMHKCKKYGLTLTPHCEKLFTDQTQTASLDMLIALRPLKKSLGLSHCTQKDLENWYGICREDTYNGGELIQIYSLYRQDLLLRPGEAPQKEELLLLHNHDDLLGMLSITELLAYRHCLTRKEEDPTKIIDAYFKTIDLTSQIIQIGFSLPVSVPKDLTLDREYPPLTEDTHLPDCRLLLSGNSGTLIIPLLQDTLKYFIPDYKNYYYLPAEDTAIHCSVAEFVDREHRKKATPSTCYLKQTGLFMPSLTNKLSFNETPVFVKNYKDKLHFVALPEKIAETAKENVPSTELNIYPTEPKKDPSVEESYDWLVPYITAQLHCFL